MRLLYTLLLLHLLPFIVLRLYWRGRKAPAYRQRLRERFAMVPTRKDPAPLVWFHCVSVGETLAATPLIKAMQQRYPGHRFCITTTTPTGSERVQALYGNSVLHYYLPYDLPSLLTLFIKALRPSLLVIMETELWPNLLATCEARKVPVMLANARLSEKSARGYRLLSGLTRPMLQQLTVIAAQSAADAGRFIALGADSHKVTVAGNIKFDVDIDPAVRQRSQALAAQLMCQGRMVALFASTHPGEDERLLPMIQRLHALDPRFLGIVVPRHPERFDAVNRLAETIGMTVVRLSSGKACDENTALVLADTMGELLALYGLARFAFVGGSLVKHGGHNLLEPAAWALPVFSGPHTHNFTAVVDLLLKANALVIVPDEKVLEQHLKDWLQDPQSLDSRGTAALNVLGDNQGALQRLLELAVNLLPAEKQ